MIQITEDQLLTMLNHAWWDGQNTSRYTPNLNGGAKSYARELLQNFREENPSSLKSVGFLFLHKTGGVIFSPADFPMPEAQLIGPIYGDVSCVLPKQDPDFDTAPKQVESLAPKPLTSCVAGRDGECYNKLCPQIRDNEPYASGRHCPLDHGEDDY